MTKNLPEVDHNTRTTYLKRVNKINILYAHTCITNASETNTDVRTCHGFQTSAPGYPQFD